MNNQNEYSQPIYPWQCTNNHFLCSVPLLHWILFSSFSLPASFPSEYPWQCNINRDRATRTWYTRTPLVDFLSPFSLHPQCHPKTWMRNYNLNPRSARNQRLVSSVLIHHHQRPCWKWILLRCILITSWWTSSFWITAFCWRVFFSYK